MARIALDTLSPSAPNSMATKKQRKIIHVDMDAFYASVEQRDNPELRGKPVIIGGPPNSRGVVCTASYEARKFGVHSAMPTSQAARLCPQGLFVKPNFERYHEASRRIRAIFHRVTPRVEPLSLDEAYLDVTANNLGEVSATRIAEKVRRWIWEETELTASAGVAPNKFLAKIASDMNKPDGLTVIAPKRVQEFVQSLPVRKVPGVGPATEKRLLAKGVQTCGDFLQHEEATLLRWFGRSGSWFWNIARGIDHREVISDSIRKSQSIEDTFPEDLKTREKVIAELERLAAGLDARLAKSDTRGRTINLKVRYDDFTTITRSRTLELSTNDQETILEEAKALLLGTEAGERPIRLLGIGLSNLSSEGEEEQLYLPFPNP